VRHLMMCRVDEVRRLRMKGSCKFRRNLFGRKVSKYNKGVARDEVVARLAKANNSATLPCKKSASLKD
jgi:hypothetical protein